MKQAAAALMLVWTAIGAGCGPRIEIVPGQKRELKLQVVFAALSDLDQIGSFSLELVVGGQAHSYALSFDAATRDFAWAGDAPAALPIHGALKATLQAYDLAGTLLPIGGKAGPIDLDSAAVDGAVVLPMLIGRLDALSEADDRVWLTEGRFLHSSTALADGSVLIVGGASAGTPAAPTSLATAVEWLQPLAHRRCTSAGSGPCAATWGQVPPPRIGHVAVRVGSPGHANCPERVFVGLGQNLAGQPLRDGYLFDPTKLVSGSAFMQVAGPGTGVDLDARIDAGAVATDDCRLVLIGGHAGDRVPLAPVQVLAVGATGVQAQASSAEVVPAAFAAAAVLLRNNVGDVLVAGGFGANGVAVDSAVIVTAGTGGAIDPSDVCATTDASCNGASRAMLCARGSVVAAPLSTGSAPWPVLILGDADGRCGSNSAEVYRSGNMAPFHTFLPIAAQTGDALAQPRGRGHSATALASGGVLIVGGTAAGQSEPPLAAVDRFELTASVELDSAQVQGRFVSLPAGLRPIAFHAASALGDNALVIGGWDGTQARSEVLLFVPPLTE